MNVTVKQKLKDIINIYGVSICDEPKRVESLLKDYCYENKKEVFLIIAALNENVVVEVQDIKHTTAKLSIVNRVTERLCDNLGITQDNAKWAVESWIYALDLNRDNTIHDSSFTLSILGQVEEIGSITISPNGKYLAYGETKGKIHIYELLSGNEITTFNHQGEVESLQFSADSRILLSAANNKVKYYKKLFSDDDYTIITTPSDKVIRLWDVVQKNECKSLSGYGCAIEKIKKEDYLYILGYSNTVKFKFNSGKIIEENGIYEISDSKFDGKYIYKEDYNAYSKEFSMKIRGLTLAEEKQIEGIKFEYPPYKNKLSHDGRLLATVLAANVNNIIKVIDIDKNEVIKTINDQIVRFIEFSNDNKRLHVVVNNRDTCELLFKVIPIVD